VIGLEQYLDSRSDKVAMSPPTPAGTEDDPPSRTVTATARTADGTPALIPRGQEFRAVVSLTIQDGWHIYANPAGLPEMRPTTLGLDPQSEATVRLLEVSYPPGESKVLGSLGTEKVALYEGKVQFTARLKLADDAKAGTAKITFRLSYQACNDKLCQAPARLEVPLTVTIGE
jgi:uncharacterized protein